MEIQVRERVDGRDVVPQSPLGLMLDAFFIQCYDYLILCCPTLPSTIQPKNPHPKRQMQTHACFKVPSVLAERRFMYKQTRSIYSSDFHNLKVLIESEIPTVLMLLLLLTFLIFLLRASHDTSFLVITDALFKEISLSC